MYWRVAPLRASEAAHFEKTHSSIFALAVAMPPVQIQFDN